MTKSSQFAVSLENVCKSVELRLPENEYLVERRNILKGSSYLDVKINAKWKNEKIIVNVVFKTSPEQFFSMSESVADEDIVDDLDSGVGELFEAAIQEEYPKYIWNFVVGAVKFDVEKGG